MRSHGLGPDYHAGHIIASMLGGSGSDLNNLVPMHKSFNNGCYKSFESEVRKWIMDLQRQYPSSQVEARIIVSIFYQQGTEIPYHIKYDAVYHVDGIEKHSYVATFNLYLR